MAAQRCLVPFLPLRYWVAVTLAAAPVSRDPDEDHVLAAAIAARADLIVTGDQDSLVLGVYAGIAILTPARVLEMLAAV